MHPAGRPRRRQSGTCWRRLRAGGSSPRRHGGDSCTATARNVVLKYNRQLARGALRTRAPAPVVEKRSVMRLKQRFSRLLPALSCAALAVCVAPAHGQNSGSAIDTGLQILQGLSPEQRSAITQQLGGAGGGSS